MKKGENIYKKNIKRIIELDSNSEQVNFLDQRFYKRHNEYYPSITYVLSSFPKGKFFEDWLKQVGSNAEYIARTSADTGTQVHNLIEVWLKGNKEILWLDAKGNALYSLEVWKMFLRFVDFWQKTKPTLIESENHLFSDTHKIAGTCDIVAEIDGELWLIDIKTSNNIHSSYELQIAAYVTCWNETYDRKINRGGVLWLKSSKRNYKLLQGNGWELIESSRTFEENMDLFNCVYKLFKLENPNLKPIFEYLPTKVSSLDNIYDKPKNDTIVNVTT